MALEYTDRLQLFPEGDEARLIPVVAQDIESGAVLMLAFTNREALQETRKSGLATFWSRSRGCLWKKGLTSGNMLRVKEIRVNCEHTSLLFLVTRLGGGACHAEGKEGHYTSCFYRRVEEDDTLTFLE